LIKFEIQVSCKSICMHIKIWCKYGHVMHVYLHVFYIWWLNSVADLDLVVIHNNDTPDCSVAANCISMSAYTHDILDRKSYTQDDNSSHIPATIYMKLAQ
jgi:hypothetical protein